MKNKLIIVAGCSGSGKTRVANKIKNSFKDKAQILCLDRFYNENPKDIVKVKSSGNRNFDHPDSLDWTLFKKCLSSLLNNKKTFIPVYNYKVHKREDKWQLIKPTKIIILEGFLALYDDSINKLASLKIFVDTPIDLCFKRRLNRDQKERNRTVASVTKQWKESVLPMYNKYSKPQRDKSDFLLPWAKPNATSIKYLLTAIKQQLKD